MNTLTITPAELVGTYRTFGEYGPLYRVEAVVNEAQVRVIVVETGEMLDYPVDQALNDPEAE